MTSDDLLRKDFKNKCEEIGGEIIGKDERSLACESTPKGSQQIQLDFTGKEVNARLYKSCPNDSTFCKIVNEAAKPSLKEIGRLNDVDRINTEPDRLIVESGHSEAKGELQMRGEE